MDFAFGEPETLADFILIGTLEILLLVIGILFALRINNWNLKRKEFQQTQDLLKLLIKDIKENRDEIERDINQGKGMNLWGSILYFPMCFFAVGFALLTLEGIL